MQKAQSKIRPSKDLKETLTCHLRDILWPVRTIGNFKRSRCLHNGGLRQPEKKSQAQQKHQRESPTQLGTPPVTTNQRRALHTIKNNYVMVSTIM